ncbi:uncharacterized protein LOC113926876 [Zalophus californianus]|uniref:Uncharacterized protein LOC113926876 n=1 Tax=Zalophus californianus TaxID=9704 RepID=A0A6J2DNS2_ZALCA|nr:uncharacterized protein LOC113926876 [Zalophus californianus]
MPQLATLFTAGGSATAPPACPGGSPGSRGSDGPAPGQPALRASRPARRVGSSVPRAPGRSPTPAVLVAPPVPLPPGEGHRARLRCRRGAWAANRANGLRLRTRKPRRERTPPTSHKLQTDGTGLPSLLCRWQSPRGVQSGQLWFCASDLLAWEMQMRRGFKRRETPEGTDIGSHVKNRTGGLSQLLTFPKMSRDTSSITSSSVSLTFTGSPTQFPDKKVGPVLPRSAQRFSGLSRMEGQAAGEMEKESNWVFPLGSQLL